MHRMGPKQLVGFVVAGGSSRRMGRDKALLAWGETTLLDHALERLRSVCGSVHILSGVEARYADRGVPVDVDAMAGAGPLGGVLTGLLQLGPASALGLFLAVDVPFASVPLLRRLVELAEDNDAVVPVAADGPHPLCAAYRATCLEPIRRRLEAGERRMTCFWPDVRVREVAAAELATFGAPAALLRNLNTPADYDGARASRGL